MVKNFESSHEIKEDWLKYLGSQYHSHSARGILVLAEYYLPYWINVNLNVIGLQIFCPLNL